MISLNCTHCRHVMEMDDAFAGGVCRCQQCGTIQTVPAKPKRDGASRPGGTSKIATNKALYRKENASDPTTPSVTPASPASGLDYLSDALNPKSRAGRAIAGGDTRIDAETSSRSAGSRKPKPKTSPVVPSVAAAGLVAVGIAAYAIFGRHSTPTRQAAPPARATTPSAGDASNPTSPETPAVAENSNATPTATKIKGPSFAGLKLPPGPVVYLVDRSQANEAIFDAVKAAVYASARSLGPVANFQIVFWHRADEENVAYPRDGLTPATAEEIKAAVARFEDVVAYGVTEFRPSLEKALLAKPASVVLVTAKGFQFGEDNVAVAGTLLAGRTVKVFAVAVGEEANPALQQVATLSKGEYRLLSPADIRHLAE